MKFVSLALLLIAVALSLVLYPRLPDPIPSHWNFAGEIDGWSPKPMGAFFLPVIIAGLIVMFAALPRISPEGFAVDDQTRAYRAIEISTVALMFCLHIVILLVATGTPLNTTLVMTVLIGALFIVLGNYMTKMRRNFFIGIRTPWTLANEDVWFRTHRVGGRVFVIAGAMLMIVPFAGLKATAVAFPVIAIAAALIPIVYSYVIYRRLTQLVDRHD